MTSWEDIRAIVEGGTALQRKLIRGNYRRFTTRAEATEFSDEKAQQIYKIPTSWAELTPWFKTLLFILSVCIALYYLKDGLGMLGERWGCMRNQ
eukprot:SAG11_NODE_151_length_14583_cov_21.306200_10_plen_94_part_00